MTARPDLSTIAEILPLDCQTIIARLSEKGLTSAEIARILNIDGSVVRQWKRGHGSPREPNGRRLAALFDLYFPNEIIPALRDGIYTQVNTPSL